MIRSGRNEKEVYELLLKELYNEFHWLNEFLMITYLLVNNSIHTRRIAIMIYHLDLTRFDKIAIQGKGPDGKWTRKPLAYRESNIFNLCTIPQC